MTWYEFLETNTFNFLLMAFFFIALFFILKVPKRLQDATEKVKEEIKASDKAKEQSFVELDEADKSVQNLQKEIEEINVSADKNISFIKETSSKEENKIIETMKANSIKTIESAEKSAVQKLSKKTVLASFELAKKHIIQLLKDNPQYHQKFIEDSINELDGLKQ